MEAVAFIFRVKEWDLNLETLYAVTSRQEDHYDTADILAAARMLLQYTARWVKMFWRNVPPYRTTRHHNLRRLWT